MRFFFLFVFLCADGPPNASPVILEASVILRAFPGTFELHRPIRNPTSGKHYTSLVILLHSLPAHWACVTTHTHTAHTPDAHNLLMTRPHAIVHPISSPDFDYCKTKYAKVLSWSSSRPKHLWYCTLKHPNCSMLLHLGCCCLCPSFCQKDSVLKLHKMVRNQKFHFTHQLALSTFHNRERKETCNQQR